MTNFEKWKDTITNVEFAMVDGELTNCDAISCMYCSFLDDYSCINARWEWLKEEYKEPEIDWSTVKVDTPIFVSNDGEHWYKRHLACYKNGVAYTWGAGATSWSAVDDTDVMSWKCVRLAEVCSD